MSMNASKLTAGTGLNMAEKAMENWGNGLEHFKIMADLRLLKTISQDLRVSWQQQCCMAFKSAACSMSLWRIVFYIYIIKHFTY